MIISLVIVYCASTWFTKNVCGMQFVFQIVCQQVMKEVTVLFLRGNFYIPLLHAYCMQTTSLKLVVLKLVTWITFSFNNIVFS